MKNRILPQSILLLYFCIFLSVSASAQNVRVTLKMENQKMETVMDAIEQQTRYLFTVDDGVDLNRRISINVKDAPLNSVLDQIAAGAGVTWAISETNIIISPKAAPESRKVTGKVTDPSGLPVPGVSVLIRNTDVGTVTDLDGVFSLEIPGENLDDILEFNSLGYEIEYLPIGQRSVFNVTLTESSLELEGTVVTALGIRRDQKALSYNVQEVSSDLVTGVKDANFINSLSGKVAGVTINASSSGVGGASKVVMRGMKSIMQSSNTLYVIDGVPMFNNSTKGGVEFDSKGSTESIADINPEDIESMSVMTGAAAAALYGSEAANGAIIITTKKGQAGGLKVTVSSGVEFLEPFILPEFQTRYGTGRQGKNTGSNIHSWGALIPKAGRYSYNPKDFMETGHIYTNVFTISGGTDKNQVYFSAGALNSDGLMPNNEYDRYNFTFRNTSHFLKDRLTLDVSASYIIQNDRNMTNQGVYSNPLVSAYLFPRGDDFDVVKAFERWDSARKIYTQFWPQGEGDLRMQNPYWIVYRNPRENSRNRYLLSASANYNVLKWLDISARVRVDNTNHKYTQKLYATSNATLLEGSDYGHYTELADDSMQTYADVIANINKIWSDMSLSAQVGASINDTRLTGMELSGPLAKPSNIFHPESIQYDKRRVTRSGWHEQTQAVFASLEVGWKSQVFITATGRNDWASQLAGSSKSSFFYPSVGLSWLPSATFNFPDAIPYVKFRASWASVGTPFPRELTYATHPYDYTTQGWEDKTNYPIGDLLPERTKTWELGFDARLKCGLDLTFSWYHADTYNQTFNPDISASSGYSDIYVQTGHVRNTGVEASIGYSNTWGRFTWNSNYTFSSNKNRIITLMNNWFNPMTGEYISKDRLQINKIGQVRFILKEGGSMGDIYSNSDVVRDDNGYIKIDNNGNLAVESNLDDMKLGSVFPQANMAWRNSFNYNGIGLSFLISARIGGVVYSATQANLDLYGVSEASAAARDAGGVLVNGRQMVDAESWYTTISAQSGIPQYYTYDATNVRLQELSLGYTFSRKWLKVCDITVSVIAKNLLMLYCKAPFDPEAVASSENFYTGIDYFMNPSTRNVGVNLRINF